ncbi:MAG: DUF2442 domain-containing protein [Nitrospira sp.]|nr:DUF2442 domain-containing protein [Nitrospira sp.]
MGSYHNVTEVVVEEGRLRIEVDGRRLSFPLAELSDRLAGSTPEQQHVFEVSPSGYGIRWPLIDEDLSIDGLLGIRHEPSKKACA